MARLDGDQVLRAALVQSVTQRYAEVEAPREEGRLAAREGAGIDPGATAEIQLNLEDE